MAPDDVELFRTATQNAIIYSLLDLCQSHPCRHIAHVLLNSIQVQKNVPSVQSLKGFSEGLYFGVEARFLWPKSLKSEQFHRVCLYIKEIINKQTCKTCNSLKYQYI
jgi:hypothetical protein